VWHTTGDQTMGWTSSARTLQTDRLTGSVRVVSLRIEALRNGPRLSCGSGILISGKSCRARHVSSDEGQYSLLVKPSVLQGPELSQCSSSSHASTLKVRPARPLNKRYLREGIE
jgi:hypothetical protein